jgi:uncharacterized membrane protein YoaK (UPF0700 family)
MQTNATIRQRGQMSEAIVTMAFLTLSGGFQDAYTYVDRGKVFANAQTGNIIFMATSFCERNWTMVLRYLAPVLAFAAGVYVASFLRQWFAGRTLRLHWRQLVLGLEIVLLFLAGLLPQQWNGLVNVLVSFVCAMQVQTFRKVNGIGFASTMCIGNLRSATEALFHYRHGGDRDKLRQACSYIGFLLLFAAGAAGGSVLSNALGDRAIWVCCGLLAVSFCAMFLPTEP